MECNEKEIYIKPINDGWAIWKYNINESILTDFIDLRLFMVDHFENITDIQEVYKTPAQIGGCLELYGTCALIIKGDIKFNAFR